MKETNMNNIKGSIIVPVFEGGTTGTFGEIYFTAQ